MFSRCGPKKRQRLIYYQRRLLKMRFLGNPNPALALSRLRSSWRPQRFGAVTGYCHRVA